MSCVLAVIYLVGRGFERYVRSFAYKGYIIHHGACAQLPWKGSVTSVRLFSLYSHFFLKEPYCFKCTQTEVTLPRWMVCVMVLCFVQWITIRTKTYCWSVTCDLRCESYRLCRVDSPELCPILGTAWGWLAPKEHVRNQSADCRQQREPRGHWQFCATTQAKAAAYCTGNIWTPALPPPLYGGRCVSSYPTLQHQHSQ